MTGEPWYVEAFGPHYLRVYAHRDDASADREAEFAARALGLAPGDRVLDLACGAGRHARALTRRGIRVTGLDLSPALLAAAAAAGGPPDLVRGDVRAIPLRAGYDAVSMFFTSFGYFAEEEDDRRVLTEAARVLVDGGRMLLDFVNREEVLRALVPESEEVREGHRIRQARGLTADGRRLTKRVEIDRGDGGAVTRYTESVRLYSPDELAGLLEGAGLPPREVYGDLSGSPFTERSLRHVVVAEKRTC